MRADDAKRLPLDRILSQLGFSPVKSKKNGRELWYTSPFRDEKEPSLHISSVVHSRLGQIWIWKDFGDTGGNVIDFALRYFRLAENDVSGALERLDGLGIGSGRAAAPSPALPASAPVSAPGPEAAACPFTNIQIEPLTSEKLITYLADRGISANLAKCYVQQVRYTFEGRRFLALAFANDQGGYEMRSTGKFKGSLPPKTITYLHPEMLDASRTVTLFEGWIDYLSALTFYGKKEASTPVLILNSIVTGEAAIEKLRLLGASKVHCYLDRDAGGRKMLAQLKAALPEIEYIDQSILYDGYKDFNEFLQERLKERGRLKHAVEPATKEETR